MKIEEKEVSLPEVMHDLKTIVQADVKARQLEFYIDTLDVVNETIICDKLRLNQVLLNILSNALKYTKPGGMVSVRVIQLSEAQEGSASYFRNCGVFWRRLIRIRKARRNHAHPNRTLTVREFCWWKIMS